MNCLRLFGVSILVAACQPTEAAEPESATPEAPASTPEPTGYDDLLRYVPAEMESVLVFELGDGDWPDKISECFADTAKRGVFAGRKFMFPSGEGWGDFEGIFLLETPETSEPPLLPDESVHAFSYATYDVRRPKRDRKLFFVQVSSTQVLYATTEEMMVEALRRRGPGGRTLAARMGWPDVPWESRLVLLRRPDLTIPTDQSGRDPRAVLWVQSDPPIAAARQPVRLRVESLALYASDPRLLEFEARVKCTEPVEADRLPEHPNLWEAWGGPGLEQVEARIQADHLVLRGNLRRLFAREAPTVAAFVLLGMLGVRVFI